MQASAKLDKIRTCCLSLTILMMSPTHGSADASKAMAQDCFDSESTVSSNGDSSTLVTSLEMGSMGEEKDWSKLADEIPVSVEAMAESEALALLKDRLQGTEKYAHEDMVDLSKELNYIPLALVQAAAFILQRSIPITEYLDKFRTEADAERVKFLADMMSALSDNERPVDPIIVKTWYISFEHIRSNHRRAASLLSQMSFCDRQSISKIIFKETLTRNSSLERKYDGEFGEDVKTLIDYCFISNETDETFKMQGLVQVITRRWLETNDEARREKKLLINKLYDVFPKECRGERFFLSRKLFPHVYELLSSSPDIFICSTDSHKLLSRAANYSAYDSKPSIGIMFIDRSIEQLEKLNKDKYSISYLYFLRGWVLVWEQRWSEAEKSLLEGKRISETTYGKEAKLTSKIIYYLMLVYTEASNERKVLELGEQIVTGCEKGKTSSLWRMKTLERSYRFQRKWQEAEELCEQMLNLLEFSDVFPEPETKEFEIIRIRKSQLFIYLGQRKWILAKKMGKRVLDYYVEKYGHRDIDTLRTMEDYALACSHSKEYSEARKWLERVLEMRTKEFPEMLRQLIVTEMYLLDISYKVGEVQLKDYIKQMLEQLNQCRTAYGEDHEYVLNTWHWVAEMMQWLGDLDGAIREMRACLKQKNIKYCGGDFSTEEKSRSLLDAWEEEQREREKEGEREQGWKREEEWEREREQERGKMQMRRCRMRNIFGRLMKRLGGCFNG